MIGSIADLAGGIPVGPAVSHGSPGVIASIIGADQIAQMYAAARGHGDSDAMRLAVAGWRAFWDERTDEAESCFRDALELAPGHGLALLGLGTVCWWADRLDEAARLVSSAATEGWSGCRAWAVLGLIARERGDDSEAERCYRRALALNPSWYPAHAGLGLVHLRRGDIRRGFVKHEWRRRTFERPAVPRWRGEGLAGRVLQLVAEQGLGDEALFGRFIPLAIERIRASGGTVVASTAPPLIHLWKSSFPPLADVVARGDVPDPPPDVWSEVESLPYLLGTTRETIPPPPYLRTDQADIEDWRRRLRLDGRCLNVGLAWAAGDAAASRPAIHGGAGTAKRHRSLPPDALAPLGRVPGVRWVSLQKGGNEDDPLPPGLDPLRLGPSLRDVGDTAAVASLLDAVVSVDTSVANLIGGMGLPGFVLLPKVADWRWMTGERTPWFPTLTLVRQERQGDWAPVVARIAAELARQVSERGAA